MTVVCGRAGWGAGSMLRAAICTTFAAFGLTTGGCGNSTITYGTATITLSATPGTFTSYFANVGPLILTRSDGSRVEPIATQERVNLATMSELSELYGSPAVPEGTYTSATLTVDYAGAVIAVDVNGQSQIANVVDPSGNPVTTVTYKITFDPAHPLVSTHNLTSRLDLNFDLSASTLITSTATPAQVVVTPFVSLSTVPTDRAPFRARGALVVVDTHAGNLVVNSRPFFDETASLGALTIQPTAQTNFTVNGRSFTGTAGLAAMSGLPVNTIVAAFGTYGALNSITPVFVPTQVLAGSSVDDLLSTRVSGTVTARSGNTLTVHGAQIFEPSAVLQSFINDLTVTVGDATVVSEDGQPAATATVDQQAISVGQQIDASGKIITSTSGTVTGIDATTGQIRLLPTTLWGTLNSGAASGSATVSVTSLGGFEPVAFNFAGTGAAPAGNANPTAYVVNTGSTDLSATPAGTLTRFSGFVTPFGSAPPDFTALSAIPGSSTDQVLIVDWVSGGSTSPFSSANASGLVLNLHDAHLGTEHFIRTGPTSIDLTNPAVDVLVVPDASLTKQLAVGNSTKGLTEFNNFPGYLTKLGSTLNGTNAARAFVAVGHYDAATQVFTAFRMDLVQQ